MENNIDIPVIYCRLIVAIARRDAEKSDALLEDTGLQEDGLAIETVGISVLQYRRLIRNVIAGSGRPEALLHIGSRIPVTAHGPIGKAFCHSPSWMTGLSLLEQFISTRGSFISMSLLDHGDCIEATINLDSRLGSEREAAYDFILGIFTTFRDSWPLKLSPVKVELSRDRSRYHGKLQSALQCEVLYNCSANSIFFSKSEVLATSPLYDAAEFHAAINECKTLLEKISQCEDIKASILEVFRRNRGVICTIDRVADSLGVSKRTLQRQLADKGKNYQGILDEWLKSLAVECLVQNGFSAEVTAAVLGYNDAATYRRAFRRWFGVSPSGFVRQYGVRA